MRTPPPGLARRLISSGTFLFVFLAAIPGTVLSQSMGNGTIEGRVLNTATGRYVNNARVSVPGTTIEARTNETGSFYLANVPAGTVTVEVRFVGFEQKSASVTVTPGGRVTQDFEIGTTSDGTIQLDPFSVEARALSGQSVALTEERNAVNIKDVISLDEFVDMADGNLGEFLKFIPGVDIEYNPFYPTSAGIRGMPASGTVIQYDGVNALAAPSVAGNRTFDLTTAANANVERLEVSKVPTPDLPANAVGGSLNLITKSAFGRKSQLLTYSLFATYTAIDGIESPGWDSSRAPRAGGGAASRVGPAFTLSYLNPLSDSLALSLSLSKSARYNDWQFFRPAWNKVTLTQTNYSFTHAPVEEFNELGSASVEWRFGTRSSVRAGYQHSSRSATLRQNSIVATPGAGAIESGGTTQGAATGVGNVAQGGGWNNQHRPLRLWSATWKFEAGPWKLDAAGSHSTAGISLLDTQNGFFNNRSSNIVNLVARNEGNNRSHERIVAGHHGVHAGGRARRDPRHGGLHGELRDVEQPADRPGGGARRGERVACV